jgi:hypothetical protein
MRRIILLAFAFLLLPASAFAAFDTGDQVTISGTATSYDGRDATVLAQRPSGLTVVDINETDSTGNVRRYAAANLKPKPTPTPSPSPTPTPTSTPSPTPTATPTDTPSPTPTATPSPTSTPDPGGLPAGVTLRNIDGGTGYWAGFPNPADGGDPDFIPLGGWFRPAASQSQMDAYKSFGMNTFYGVECPECAQESLLRSNGLKAFMSQEERTRFNDIGSETVGWLLSDEQDMCCGPPGFAGGNGFTTLGNESASLPDQRAEYVNYGKGAAMWESDNDAQQWFNSSWGDTISMDVYWMTDPNERGGAKYGMPSSYGWNVERQRFLDGLDGKRKPQLGIVETGWPFTEGAAAGGRRILPAEARAAVWHSFIAGARGIVYFDHNFGAEACNGSTILGSCYADTRAALVAVNAQVKSLGGVLNSPFADGYASAPSGVKVMAKRAADGTFYVFAGSAQTASQTVDISVKSGSTATVLGESRTVPVTGGSFSDTFADKNAVHIYRIDP